MLSVLEAITCVSTLYITARRGGAMSLNRSPNTCLNYTFACYIITLSGLGEKLFPGGVEGVMDSQWVWEDGRWASEAGCLSEQPQ